MPMTDAATTSTMRPDAITDFVLVNRSGFIVCSTRSFQAGKPTEGLHG